MRPCTLPCLLICIICTLLFQINLQAQAVCGFDRIHRQLENTSPEFKKRVRDNNEKVSQWLSAKQQNNKLATNGRVNNGAETIYEIPVVLHVMHTGGAIGTQYNPSDAQLTGMIDYLNQSFQASWSGYSSDGEGGTRVPFRFVLAQRAPDCTPTTGIVRVDASALADYASFGIRAQTTTGAPELNLKALSIWPSTQYYNVWIVNRIDGKDGYPGTVGPFIAGYAYFPGAPARIDGTVMLASQAVAGQSTLPHEMGHAFNLYHTFEEAAGSDCAENTDCSNQGDLVCDTDPVNEDAFFMCPASSDINPCTGLPWNGQQYNFMHYTSCPDQRFTLGQRDRMIASVNTVRVGLLSSAGLRPPDLITRTASCGPTYITMGNNPNDMGPVRIKFNTLDDSSFSYSRDYKYYEDNTCNMGTTVLEGQTYTLKISTRTNQQVVKAWIDFNDNGSFEPTEQIMESYTPGGLFENRYTHTADINIPAGTTLNVPLRMRVLADWINNYTITACDGLMYGQTEDYSVTVLSASVLPVRFIDERIKRDFNTVQVSFKVSEEQNVVRYELQRTGNISEGFVTVKQIRPVYSNKSINEYSISDILLDDDAAWYRVMAVQQDGTRYYSRILGNPLATTPKNELPKVYPNPSGGEFQVSLPLPAGLQVQLTLTDAQGRRVWSGTRVSGRPLFINGNFAAGIYYLTIVAGETRWNTKLIISGK